MKIRNLSVENFKQFKEKTIDFCDPDTGLVQDMTVLIGNNGSGKSTILQAIAMMLATATHRLKTPDKLYWPGFDLELVNSAWQRPIDIKLEIEFSQDEIEATQSYFEKTSMAERDNLTRPGSSQIVQLKYDAETSNVYTRDVAEFYQFSGHRYARMIQRYVSDKSRLFEQVGDIFWYTEERTTNTLGTMEDNGKSVPHDMESLRRTLSNLYYFHQRVRNDEYILKAGQRDIFETLAQTYQTVFPSHELDGPLPRTAVGDDVTKEPWFNLYDSKRNLQYEISEMSGGERAIFPILFEFAVRDIHNSIILIDELELHLHPPYQQAFLQALQKLGNNNQFIITTHSDAVESIIPPEVLRRL